MSRTIVDAGEIEVTEQKGTPPSRNLQEGDRQETSKQIKDITGVR